MNWVKRRTVKNLKIEIVVAEASHNSTVQLYDVVMRLHMPDGKPPTDHFLDGGPYDREGVSLLLGRIYTLIGENFCKPSETFGAAPSSTFLRRPS